MKNQFITSKSRCRLKLAVTLGAMLAVLPVASAKNPDHVLWYDHPASKWTEALPVGNGRMGAMIYGGIKSENIQLNEESLWGGMPVESNADASSTLPEIQRLLLEGQIDKAKELSERSLKSNPMRIRPYQTFGNLLLDFWGPHTPSVKGSSYRRELDMEDGLACVSYRIGNVTYTRELFVSAPDDVLALRIRADQPGALTFRLQYTRQQDATAYPLDKNTLAIEGQVFDLPEEDMCAPGLHERFAGLVRGKHKGGKMTVRSNAFYVEGADEAVFYFTAATDYNFSKLDFDSSIDPIQRCKDLLEAIDEKCYDTIRKRHMEEHASLFNRVSFHLGEAPDLPTDQRLARVKKGETDLPLIATYFQYGRYLLMNSSRSPGILPANLQGIWNQDIYPVWSSDFHTNINIQMNYWPAEVCNLPETVLPFSRFINALRKPGRVTARKTFNSKGWTLNHLTDPYGHTSISDGVGWGTFPIAGAWLALHLWEHYRFTEDKKYLCEEAYPCMAEAAEFLLHFLVKDKKGHWVTAPSNSPENHYRLNGKNYNLTYGATMDIEIIHELFDACLEAGRIVPNDMSFNRRLEAVRKQLPPIRISTRYGTIQEWIEDYEEAEPGHRHISHLFGLYPGTQITPTNKQLFEAARKTIERRRYYNENEANRNGSYTGWSRAWMINFYARLLDGEEAGKNVNLLLQKNTADNLFNLHPPFQIDGNFGGTAGIAEMLIQSHLKEIQLLPALPPQWKDGEVKGLCARPGIETDMVWKEGSLRSATFRSKTDRKVTISYKGHKKTIRLKAGENKQIIF